MANKGKPKTRKASLAGSLLSPEAMGGLVAGGGLDFQLRYAACHLPLWLRQGQFQQLFFEGTGDIDIRSSDGSSSSRKHIQVKDHEVSPAELLSAIEQFRRSDAGMPGVYQSFTLACPSLSPLVRPVEAALARYRGAKPFYDDVPQALAATEQDLTERLRKVGLDGHVDFIRTKVYIEIGHGDLRYDERAVELFISRLLEHPEYVGKLRAMVAPAFAEVIRAVSARRGVVMDRVELERILETAVGAGSTEPVGLTIWIQNWTIESFDRAADYVLNWSPHFDRATRRVPSPETWNAKLLPELRALQKRIATERKERFIHFRGKCALSTGIAVGATFPLVGGWTFEVPQPPSQKNWRSDAAPTAAYELQTETVDGAADGTELILALNIKGDGREDVRRYVEGAGTRPTMYAFVAPPSPGALAIRGSEDACAFALSVRNFLGALLKKHRLVRTHLFFYGPLALSIFVGQQLTAVGEIQLYEYQDPGYLPSCTLRT
jgi:hypothetical protein